MDVNEELKFLLKFKKKMGGRVGSGGLGRGNGVWLGVRVDVNKELKFLGKFTQKNRGVGRGWGSGGGRVGGGGGQGGCERNVGGRGRCEI